MITEIPKKEWKEFLDNLSRDLDGWETHIEVFSSDVGAQVISEGLPFHGLTAEPKGDDFTIELLIGSGTESHQTHVISNPVRIAFEGPGVGPHGVLDIEDASNTKTLIKFIQPFPVLVEYENTEIIATATVR